MNDVSEVSPVPQGRVQVGPELLSDELDGRLVAAGPDGLRVHTALVEDPHLPQLSSPGVRLAQAEDEV